MQPIEAAATAEDEAKAAEEGAAARNTYRSTSLDNSHADLRPDPVSESSAQKDSWAYRVFDDFIRVAIVVNVVFLGLSMNYEEHKDIWRVLEHIFTFIFAVEMFIKLYLQRCEYFWDSWNRMDFVLAWLSIIDVWILAAASQSASLRQLSGVRLLRLMRVMRALRIIEVRQELVVMAESMYAAMKALFWISLMLIVVIYTSALFMKGAIVEHNYDPAVLDVNWRFGTLAKSMLTMFNICIAAEWVEVAKPAFDNQFHVFAFCVIYVFITTFGILNLVIGVIAERTMAAQQAFVDAEEDSAKQARMRNILVMSDAIFAGKEEHEGVAMQEMESIVAERPELMELLMTCGLPRGFDIRSLHLMFDEEYGGTVDKEEFTTGMFRLIFNNEFQRDCCTLLTVAQVKMEVKSVVQELKQELEQHMDRLFAHVGKGPTEGGSPRSEALRSDLAELLSHPPQGPPSSKPSYLAEPLAEPLAERVGTSSKLTGSARVAEGAAAWATAVQIEARLDSISETLASVAASCGAQSQGASTSPGIPKQGRSMEEAASRMDNAAPVAQKEDASHTPPTRPGAAGAQPGSFFATPNAGAAGAQPGSFFATPNAGAAGAHVSEPADRKGVAARAQVAEESI